MNNPPNTTPDGDEVELMRKQLEKAGLYDVLVHLHEQKHNEEDCFCTTEIAGAYTKLLSLISAHTEAKSREKQLQALLHVYSMLQAAIEVNGANSAIQLIYKGKEEAWEALKLAQLPKEES